MGDFQAEANLNSGNKVKRKFFRAAYALGSTAFIGPIICTMIFSGRCFGSRDIFLPTIQSVTQGGGVMWPNGQKLVCVGAGLQQVTTDPPGLFNGVCYEN